MAHQDWQKLFFSNSLFNLPFCCLGRFDCRHRHGMGCCQVMPLSLLTHLSVQCWMMYILPLCCFWTQERQAPVVARARSFSVILQGGVMPVERAGCVRSSHLLLTQPGSLLWRRRGRYAVTCKSSTGWVSHLGTLIWKLFQSVDMSVVLRNTLYFCCNEPVLWQRGRTSSSEEGMCKSYRNCSSSSLSACLLICDMFNWYINWQWDRSPTP